MDKLPEFPYNHQILDMYMQEPTNPIWLKYTKLQKWQKEINQFILALYQSKAMQQNPQQFGEIYYAMQEHKPVLSQYD